MRTLRLTLPIVASLLAAAAAPDPSFVPVLRDNFPDPFVLKDASRVKSKADWERRRGELKEMILYYEYGRMPPAPGNVNVTEERWTPPPPPRPTSRPATRPGAQPANPPPAPAPPPVFWRRTLHRSVSDLHVKVLHAAQRARPTTDS